MIQPDDLMQKHQLPRSIPKDLHSSCTLLMQLWVEPARWPAETSHACACGGVLQVSLPCQEARFHIANSGFILLFLQLLVVTCLFILFTVQERLQRQQREVERVAYDARQRILSEETRIKEMKAAAVREAEERQRMMKELEGQLQQRQEAVAGKRRG